MPTAPVDPFTNKLPMAMSKIILWYPDFSACILCVQLYIMVIFIFIIIWIVFGHMHAYLSSLIVQFTPV